MNDFPSWFVERVSVDISTGCWNWTGTMWNNGYARICRPRTIPHTRGHRYAYAVSVGPIPPGLVLDHLCRNTRCVNPDHLEAVTDRENVLRGVGISAMRAKQTHCKRGHEFTPENTGRQGNGRRKRYCKECCRALANKSGKRRWRPAAPTVALIDADLAGGMPIVDASTKYGLSVSYMYKRRHAACQIQGIPTCE